MLIFHGKETKRNSGTSVKFHHHRLFYLRKLFQYLSLRVGMLCGFITIKIQKAGFVDAGFQMVPNIDYSSVPLCLEMAAP